MGHKPIFFPRSDPSNPHGGLRPPKAALCTAAVRTRGGLAARCQKVNPIYGRLDALGAQWQEVYGWERPQYFGEPERHSFRRSNAFDFVAQEVRGTRQRVGIADLTAFAKLEVT